MRTRVPEPLQGNARSGRTPLPLMTFNSTPKCMPTITVSDATQQSWMALPGLGEGMCPLGFQLQMPAPIPKKIRGLTITL
jgi:hypothetical protein